MVQRYETLSRHTIRLSPNTYLLTDKLNQQYCSFFYLNISILHQRITSISRAGYQPQNFNFLPLTSRIGMFRDIIINQILLDFITIKPKSLFKLEDFGIY